MYEPLISADGKHWRMLPPFNVQFKPGPRNGEEIWLETPIYHFSEGVIGQVISKKSKANTSRFLHEDMPRYLKWKNRESVLFGNATEVSVPSDSSTGHKTFVFLTNHCVATSFSTVTVSYYSSAKLTNTLE